MENIKWLMGLMDKKYRKWHVLALCISAVTSLMLLTVSYTHLTLPTILLV